MVSFHYYMFYRNSLFNTKSVDADQTSRYVGSNLGLHVCQLLFWGFLTKLD